MVNEAKMEVVSIVQFAPFLYATLVALEKASLERPVFCIVQAQSQKSG